jgi:fructose transport system substrate-binding protein
MNIARTGAARTRAAGAIAVGAIASAAIALGLASPAMAAGVTACLITKTDSNPYFVKMKEGAQAEAKKLGMQLKSYAGKYDGDNQSQVNAVEACMASGAKGILITASSTKAIVPTLEKARKAGLLVIALDTPLDPANAADMTFATDNFHAAELDGEWAKAKLGKKAKDAKIAFLDLAVSQPTVGVERDQGFMKGFGIDIKNPDKWGDETDPRIVGHAVTGGSIEGGQKAMETLLARNPNINLVYAINEPAAEGAYQALKSVGKAKGVTIVAIDGSCRGVRDVQKGIIGATAQQYPLMMAKLGVEAVYKYVETGAKPKATPGKDFYDTGTNLITKDPQKGVPSITVKKGLALCWG